MRKGLRFEEMELPSNRKFGTFFIAIFSIIAIYFFYIKHHTITFILIFLAAFLLLITFLKPNWLLPLNKFWMRIGYVLSMIISPIVMAFIFFGLITPYSIVMRIIGRDELRLIKTAKKSYWISREHKSSQIDFKRQF